MGNGEKTKCISITERNLECNYDRDSKQLINWGGAQFSLFLITLVKKLYFAN